MMDFKQVIIFRKDLPLSRGKAIVQGCHASLESYLKADPSSNYFWRQEGMRKIVLEVEDEKKLLEKYKEALAASLPAYLVKDRGLTEVKPGTITALGIGPALGKEVDKVTGNLPMMKNGEKTYIHPPTIKESK